MHTLVNACVAIAAVILLVSIAAIAAIAGSAGANACSTTAAGPVGGVPNQLIPIYQAAAARYGLGPQGPAVLAAINEVETQFGRDLSTSNAGAVGWMQFEPGTWAIYGVTPDGSKAPDGPAGWDNPTDAIFSAANLLHAGGAPADWQTAIFTYNHAQWYVDRVLSLAQRYYAAGISATGAVAGVSATGAAGATSATSATGATSFATVCATIASTGYANPLAHIQGLTPERIDMGVDYAGSGTLDAIGTGQITNLTNAGWPNGAFIDERLTTGQYAGKYWYYAEDITPTVKIGQTVDAGAPIGQMFNGGSGIETGWSTGTGGTALAASLGQIPATGDPGGWSSAAGASASRLLASLGAPAGIMHPGGPHGTMPPGYP